jgi:hypothetical protein
VAEDPGSCPGRRRQQAAKRLGCAAIVFAAGAALGLSVHHGLQTAAAILRPGSIRTAVVAEQQEECIYRAIRSELPKGAAVYIDDDPDHDQRLAELSTLWAVPQGSPHNARWTMSLVPGSAVPGDCFGLALKVGRR